MASDWEAKFREWAKPPGRTEQEKCENAERAIRSAITASDKLKYRDIRIFTQGSYRNNTNVRKDSDVDIGILCYDTFFPDYPEGYTAEDFGHPDAKYHFSDFKNDVEKALVNHFGSSAVHRGNKAFDVHENTYRVDADVAPFFEHRRYEKDGKYLSGVQLIPDNGGRVRNWPEQHYQNGVQKNERTGRRFKAMVRILKSLCNQMTDEGITAAKNIPGFLIECLVWNVPDGNFGHATYKADVRACMAHLFNNTLTDERCSEWGEASELKYLFRSSQKWTREQAHAFLDAAWDYVGFEG